MPFDPNELKFADIIEATANGVLIVNNDQGKIVYVNRNIEKIFGYEAHELIGNSVDILVPMGSRGHHQKNRDGYTAAPHARNFPESAGIHGQHKDGHLVPVEASLLPLITTTRRLTIVTVNDISARRKAEEEREDLVRELNHRVKNNMAIVTAIAGQTRKYTTNLQDFFEGFNGRMQALAAAHDLVAEAKWEDTNLYSLLTSVLKPFDLKHRFNLTGPTCLIPAEFTSTLGIVFHELTTNAIKYGALTTPDGSVDISWECNTLTALSLDWVENGTNDIKPPTRKGFGSVMIERTITKNFGGRLNMEYTPIGLRYHIEIDRLRG